MICLFTHNFRDGDHRFSDPNRVPAPSRSGWVRLPVLIGLLLAAAVIVSTAAVEAAQQASPWKLLGEQLVPLSRVLNGQQIPFELQGRVGVALGDQRHEVQIRLTRWNQQDYDFVCEHAEYAIAIHHRVNQTVLFLPKHQTAFRGTGKIPVDDSLRPSRLLARLVDSDSQLQTLTPMLRTPPGNLAFLLDPLKILTYDASAREWQFQRDVKIRMPDPAANPDRTQDSNVWQMSLQGASWGAELQLSAPSQDSTVRLPDGTRTEEIERSELERQLVRGVRRALAILAPSKQLTQPPRKPKKVEHGELRFVEGQRVVLLKGTPEQMGTAHGKLLRDEAIRCLDSVLHTFGTVQTIRTGRWFRHDLEAAYARLEPHIPDRHQQELTALAVELKWDPQLVKTLNVFPELFHCSGFAVFGSATRDGVLYHGRVLDYMTTIGLQDAAATFIVAPEGYEAFANVGYGGFVGSVSGMNAAGISLGEMGGRGEGLWDGVPMATLMRRALEECRTLDEVIALWQNNPRTCEYYYVFAEGKPGVRRAVGVAATPERLELVQPGAAHELLGPGIPDALVLSAGDRLQTLRERMQSAHGSIDQTAALAFMARPVAMKSNLHNVLFVPEQGLLYVSHASHQLPAADLPYVELNVHQLLQDVARWTSTPATP